MAEDEELLESTPAPKTWRTKLRAALGHIGLLVTLILYTVLGGIVFKELEYPTEVSTLADLDSTVRSRRSIFLSNMQSAFNNASSPENFINYVQNELSIYEEAVQEAAEGGVLVPLAEGTSPVELARWNYLQAIFFASTIITTIGYGNIVPVTLWGRIFCLLYALIGIPLALSAIADVGFLFASSLPSLPSLLPSSRALKSLLSACAALGLLLVYLSVGAVLFMFLEEDWDFFASFYFCFITMTTIGFGDLVPQKPEYMLLCTLYILVGLSVTSTIIEIVRLEYEKSWKRLQALAETLKKLGEGQAVTDVNALQSDLKKMLSLVSTGVSNGKRKGSKEWDAAIKNITSTLSTINKGKPKSKKQPILQIIIYETSV